MQPSQTQTAPTQQDSRDTQHHELMPQSIQRHEHYQAAGVPVWGVLLILIGVIALFGNLGIGLGWLFGLALGAWLVYLGTRHVSDGGAINWWLTGLGLLIGLGSISSGFLDKLVFPLVLIIVGLGIIGQQYMSRQNR